MGGPENAKRDHELEKEPPRQSENPPRGSGGESGGQVQKNIDKIRSETNAKLKKYQ